jgi:hypothetical protein
MLNEQGVDNNRIGWDSKRGTVTVDNREFMKPNKVYQGTSYADKSGFNQAYNTFNKPQQQTYQPQSYQQNVISTGQQNPYQNMANNVNPADQQVNDMIGSIMQQMNNREQFDPYSSPAYEAAEARSERAAQQGIRAAQESMGSAGFGRSTALGERAQGIQNDQNEYLMTQVIPQIMAQNEAKKQQELQNMMSMLNPMMNQQGVYDSRDQFDRNFALNEGQVTGRYMPPEAQSIIDNILELKRQAESTQGQQVQNLSSQADVLRGQLRGMGIDPSFIGADVNMNTASHNRAGAGIQTLAGQQQEFNQGVTMAELTGFMPDGTPTNAKQQQDLQNEWMVAEQMGVITPGLSQLYGLQEGTPTWRAKQDIVQNRINQQNANTSSYNAQTSRQNSNQSAQDSETRQLMQIWEATGVAPAGIPGVEPGTPIYQREDASPALASDLYDDINKRFLVDETVPSESGDGSLVKTGKKVVSDPTQLEAYILSQDLSDEEAEKAYRYYGLDWGG